MQYDNDNTRTAEKLAVGLGLFSIGLGLAELLAPRSVARAIGMPDASDGILQAFGAREIANGVAILSQPENPFWLWSRVGGDGIARRIIGPPPEEERRLRLRQLLHHHHFRDRIDQPTLLLAQGVELARQLTGPRVGGPSVEFQ